MLRLKKEAGKSHCENLFVKMCAEFSEMRLELTGFGPLRLSEFYDHKVNYFKLSLCTSGIRSTFEKTHD